MKTTSVQLYDALVDKLFESTLRIYQSNTDYSNYFKPKSNFEFYLNSLAVDQDRVTQDNRLIERKYATST